MSQMRTIRLGKRPEHRVLRVKDYAPPDELVDLKYGGTDINEENLYAVYYTPLTMPTICSVSNTRITRQ